MGIIHGPFLYRILNCSLVTWLHNVYQKGTLEICHFECTCSGYNRKPYRIIVIYIDNSGSLHCLCHCYICLGQRLCVCKLIRMTLILLIAPCFLGHTLCFMSMHHPAIKYHNCQPGYINPVQNLIFHAEFYQLSTSFVILLTSTPASLRQSRL